MRCLAVLREQENPTLPQKKKNKASASSVTTKIDTKKTRTNSCFVMRVVAASNMYKTSSRHQPGCQNMRQRLQQTYHKLLYAMESSGLCCAASCSERAARAGIQQANKQLSNSFCLVQPSSFFSRLPDWMPTALKQQQQRQLSYYSCSRSSRNSRNSRTMAKKKRKYE